MRHPLSSISTQSKNATTNTEAAAQYLMDYAYHNPDAAVMYRASDMILACDSDASYLVEPMARSRCGGYHYLTSKDGTLFNGAINVLVRVIKNVMASAMEAEIAGLYENAQLVIEYRRTLEELGFPQPPTVIRTDNKTACGIVNGTMKQKRSKAIDMRYHWMKDRTNNHKQFRIVWASGKENFGDYPTKHHPPAHHRRTRPIWLHVAGKSPTTLKGCIELLNSN